MFLRVSNEAKRYFSQGISGSWPSEDSMESLLRMYRRAGAALSLLQSPMLLAVRLYWGFQFAQTGWAKLHNLAKITGFFASLKIPFPAFNAHFVSGLEFIGGILLMLGLFSRPIALLLAGEMLVAYWTADHEALTSIFSDPGKFYVADPYTLFFASLLVVVFGAGFHDAYKFANKSGINLLDFPLSTAMRDVFANDSGFQEIDGTLSQENANFTWQNDQVTFVDSQDLTRLLSVNNNTNRLNEALAFQLTTRGIPVIYYGDEQYLHNDTNGGNDPYNRPQMTSFSTTTPAYKMIGALSALRQTNDALAYGSSGQRYITNDVYVYERRFFNNIVLVAINKNNTSSYTISNMNTALPSGAYTDYLGSLLSGTSLTVHAGTGGNNPVSTVVLPANSVSVWQVTGGEPGPSVGSIGPTVGQSGMRVTIAGDNFGATAGTVAINNVAASIQAWSNTSVTFTVPNVANGVYQTQLKSSSGAVANPIQFTVLAAKLIPVTFTVNNATPTSPGDYIFLTGNTVELGQWGTTFDTAVGPMLDPSYPNWFLNVSVPAGQSIQFKFVKIAANGTVTYEGGSNHSYIVPTSGVGTVNVNWQN